MNSSELTIANGVSNLASVARPAPVTSGNERQDVSASGKVSPQQAEPAVTREAVAAAVSDISDYVQNISRELQFQIDDNVGSTVITVTDRETGDIIRQIPQEEVVRLARYIAENAPDPVTGLLVNVEGLK